MKTKEEKEARGVYDRIALKYHTHRTKINPDGWFYNEMLEMPATLELLENVKGKKILDFGCGSGIYAKLLAKKGAIVKGFDISEGMLKIARNENPDIEFRQGSGYNIPFKEEFDIVVAPLVMDYFDNWDKVFREVSRVLRRDGFFIFSAGNPICETVKKIGPKGDRLKVLGINNYFEEKVHYSNWNFPDGSKESVPGYHKTYETIIKTIVRNGFEIVDYKDTKPLKKAKKLFPEDYEEYSKIPYFCVWKVMKK